MVCDVVTIKVLIFLMVYTLLY